MRFIILRLVFALPVLLIACNGDDCPSGETAVSYSSPVWFPTNDRVLLSTQTFSLCPFTSTPPPRHFVICDRATLTIREPSNVIPSSQNVSMTYNGAFILIPQRLHNGMSLRFYTPDGAMRGSIVDTAVRDLFAAVSITSGALLLASDDGSMISFSRIDRSAGDPWNASRHTFATVQRTASISSFAAIAGGVAVRFTNGHVVGFDSTGRQTLSIKLTQNSQSPVYSERLIAVEHRNRLYALDDEGLFRIDIAASTRAKLVDGVVPDFDVTRDGSHIVFTTASNDAWLADSNATPLHRALARCRDVRFSPDGTRLFAISIAEFYKDRPVLAAVPK